MLRYCFLGLILFNFFSELVGRAPSLVIGNVNYVKKVVFPLDVLPVIAVGTSLFNAGIGVGVFAVLAFAMGTPIASTIIWLPLAFIPVALLALGVTWFLASLGVFVRDTAQVVGLLLTGANVPLPHLLSSGCTAGGLALATVREPTLNANRAGPQYGTLRAVTGSSGHRLRNCIRFLCRLPGLDLVPGHPEGIR